MCVLRVIHGSTGRRQMESVMYTASVSAYQHFSLLNEIHSCMCVCVCVCLFVWVCGCVFVCVCVECLCGCWWSAVSSPVVFHKTLCDVVFPGDGQLVCVCVCVCVRAC